MFASFYPLDASVWGMLQQEMLKNTNTKVFFLKHMQKQRRQKQSSDTNNADNADSFYQSLTIRVIRVTRVLRNLHDNLLFFI